MGKKKSKGKTPPGRAGAKKKAQKGWQNGNTRQNDFMQLAQSSSMRQVLYDDDDEDTFGLRGFRGFAQTNTRTFSPRNPLVKLRHQHIAFVSAGTNTPVENETPRESAPEADPESTEEESEEAEEEEDIEDDAIQTNILTTQTDTVISEVAGVARLHIESSAEMVDNSDSDVNIIGVDTSVQNQNNGTAPLFVVDTVGDPSMATFAKANGKQPIHREASPARSSSSEEAVVFQGRNKPAAASGKNATQLQKQPATTSQSSRTQRSSRPDLSIIHATGWAAKPSWLDEENPNAIWAPAPAGSWWKKSKNRPDLDPSPEEKKALEESPPKQSKVMFAEPRVEAKVEEEYVEATIASLQADWRAVLQDKRRAKQPLQQIADKVDARSPKSPRRGKRGRKKDNRQLRKPITSDDEDEDEQEAAYDDYMANLASQLDGHDSSGDGSNKAMAINANHSASISGPSLVVKGEEIDEGEILDENFSFTDNDTSSESTGPIGQDLYDESMGDLESSELEDELEYTEKQQWEDEEDLRERRKERMTDEQIARLLSKQYELGIDGDELVLENGEYASKSDQAEGIGDVEAARAGIFDITNRAKGPSSNKHGMRRRNGGHRNFSFPDATGLAEFIDQYGENGFDIMDFDRPSLRQRKKGRRGQLPPELEALSDEELQENMMSAWDNDRAKKRLKKAEREELRSQGLLGATAKKGKADFNQKYQYGISKNQIIDELRAFLQDDGQSSRPFPPMDKEERKALHEIASALNLKSKSVGAGQDRFPVLYKTARTIYSAAMFEEVVEASTKGMLGGKGNRFSKKFAKKNLKAVSKFEKKGGFGSKEAATVRHGEIVGAGAAEIGTESFGHKMMEKMGWSKGMALGKEGEGRLLPVEQIMRSGTKGLGG